MLEEEEKSSNSNLPNKVEESVETDNDNTKKYDEEAEADRLQLLSPNHRSELTNRLSYAKSNKSREGESNKETPFGLFSV